MVRSGAGIQRIVDNGMPRVDEHLLDSRSLRTAGARSANTSSFKLASYRSDVPNRTATILPAGA